MNHFSGDTHSLVLLTILLAMSSCKDNSTSPKEPRPNLILNPSFEFDSVASLRFWSTDTFFGRLVRDAPPLGGLWSLELEPDRFGGFGGWARTYVTGQSDRGIYKLTVWMKSTSHTKGGWVSLGRWARNEFVDSKLVYLDSLAWSQVSITDTFSLQASDTIAVELSAGSTELATWQVLFDLVRLERLY